MYGMFSPATYLSNIKHKLHNESIVKPIVHDYWEFEHAIGRPPVTNVLVPTIQSKSTIPSISQGLTPNQYIKALERKVAREREQIAHKQMSHEDFNSPVWTYRDIAIKNVRKCQSENTKALKECERMEQLDHDPDHKNPFQHGFKKNGQAKQKPGRKSKDDVPVAPSVMPASSLVGFPFGSDSNLMPLSAQGPKKGSTRRYKYKRINI